jgi:hypothetical protein
LFFKFKNTIWKEKIKFKKIFFYFKELSKNKWKQFIIINNLKLLLLNFKRGKNTGYKILKIKRGKKKKRKIKVYK